MQRQTNLTQALRVLRRDPVMRALIEKHPRPHFASHTKQSTVFQSLLRSIISQQISGKAAASIHKKVRALFSNNYPTPEKLASISDEALQQAGLSPQKRTYVRDLGAHFSAKSTNVRRFPRMSSEDIIADLVRIRGIGEWTVQMMLIFHLGRLDILPTLDLGVQRGCRSAYKLPKDPSKSDLERIAQDWRPYASIAAWYFWRESDGLKQKRDV